MSAVAELDVFHEVGPNEQNASGPWKQPAILIRKVCCP